MKFYILDNKEPRPVASKTEWIYWMENFEYQCIVNETTLNQDILIVTSFTGYSSGEETMLFETIIMGGVHNSRTWKTDTWEGAAVQHDAAVQLVMAELN